MKELKEKAQALIDKYTSELESKGLKILLSKKYLESAVSERAGGTGAVSIFNSIDRARDRKKEKENGYNYERNKYHYLILTLCPIEKNLVPREEQREYAFVIKKVDRPHIGEEPCEVVYTEEKVLSKIEKRIFKILKKAEKSSPQKMCKNNISDAIRYTMSAKYEYKKRYLGKDSYTWDLLLGIGVGVLCIAFVFACWLISKLR